jgi:hypothetical protein
VNRIEDRLRDAFAAAADTVRPEAVRGLADRPVLARSRRIAPLAAAAAVAVVVIGASVATPLVLARSHHSRAPSTGAGPSEPAASAGPSGAVLVVPNVTGMSVSQATATLHTLGLRISEWPSAAGPGPTGTVLSQIPAAGTRAPPNAIVALAISSALGQQVTVTLAPGRVVTVSAFAATIEIPRSWQPTPGLGPAVGYNGSSGWVQLRAEAEPAGIRAACRAVAAVGVSQYGHRPLISYRRIDGRPGCQIVPDLVNGALPMTAVVVEYRSRLRDGANVLVVDADPATMAGVIASVKLRH